MNIYTLGMPTTVLVDDWLPLQKLSNGTYVTEYAEVSEDKALWGPIIEKMFAKRYGNYEHIIGGLPSNALQTLTGAPSDEYLHKNIKSKDTIWEVLSKSDAMQDFITAGTESAESDQIRNEVNLAKNHAYTVLGVKTLSNGTKLIQIRNPWGSE